MLELLGSRAQVYRLLRDAFSYPLSQAVLTQLDALQPDDGVAPELREPLLVLQGVLHGPLQGPELVEHLNLEYSRLIVGPGLPPAPPFGSYYRDAGHTLFGPETQAVARAYRQAGFEPGDPGTPADHIVLELDFMAALADSFLVTVTDHREAEAVAVLDTQRGFLQNHLLPLGERFSESLAHATSQPFFTGVASLLYNYLTLDLALLGEIQNRLGARSYSRT
ncbi:MAG TPA: molecular chaperone TorD family protein [Symbiobacteriaceae bacterium]|jgi:TorA maturation chaperone TorD